MTRWNVTIEDGNLKVDPPIGETLLGEPNDTLFLIRTYRYGSEVHSITTHDDVLRVLYDEYQMNDAIKEGDEFFLDGKPFAYCTDVHVVPFETNQRSA